MGTQQLVEKKLGALKLPAKFIEKIHHDLEYIFSCELEDLEQIILFGSCARGKVKAGSDVDWMLVTNKPIEDRRLRNELYCDICDDYKGVSADLVLTTVKARSERSTTFMKFVAEDEVILWERGERV